MLINLFQTVRSSGVPCTLRELLDLLGALEKQLAYSNIDDFYYLSRAILVKDEKHYDKFDKAFDIYFKGIEKLEDIFQALIPEDWLRKAFEKELDPDELKKIQSLGGLEKLLEEFKKRLEEQKDVDALVKKAVADFGSLDILVNNASGLIARKKIAEMELSHWEAVMTLNLTSTFMMTKACLAHMKSGSIVNLASQAGRDGGGPGAS